MSRKRIFLVILLGIFLLFPSFVQASDEVIVALDPGHGGNDVGAVGGNLRESDINWKLASRVKEILDAEPGITGVLTKSQYETVDGREERARRALANDADLLVSFHINSNASSNSLSGAEVYVTRYTAEDRFYKNSNILGLDILKNLKNIGVQSHSPKPIVRVGADWDKYQDGSVADYYGIISWPVHLGIPGVLIEHAFINNPYDRANYLNDTMINKMAEADAKAIIDNKDLFRFDKSINSVGATINKLEMVTSSNNVKCISGELYVNNWINNVAMTPENLPKVRLVSTDGAKSYDMWVAKRDGNLYYFDGSLETIDKSYEYILQVETDERNLIPVWYTTNVTINNMAIGKVGQDTVKIVDNKLIFECPPYEGNIEAEIEDIQAKNTDNNKVNISGNMNITEVVNGNVENLDRMPKLSLEDVLGNVVGEFNVSKVSESKYSFSLDIENNKQATEYVIKVESGNSSNTSQDRIDTAKYNKNETLLKAFRTEVRINDSKIIITPVNYQGDIGISLENFEMAKNDKGETYIYGDVIINEWIDGKALIPDVLPTIKVKTEAGEEVFEAWVNNIGGNKYHFDTYIEGIDTSKEYVIEASLENTYNISKYKSANILSEQNKTLGTFRDYDVILNDGKMIFGIDTYKGDLGTEVIALYLNKNTKGEHYISGNIYITEWINGTTWSVPKKTPIIRIKTIEGEIEKEAWVNNIGGNEYYFDSYIEGIDTSKEYVIEVELANVGNISKNKKGNAYFGSNMDLGEYSGKEMKVESGKIVFRTNEYSADLGQSLDWIELHENENKEKYINGNIYITEWVNGTTWSEPKELPKIVIKTEEGEEVKECWVSKVEGNKYYFDSYIEGIDVNKEYEIEVELQGNNASKYKSGKVDFGKEKLLGEYKETRVKVKGTKIRFESEKYSADLGQTIDWIELNENGNKEKYINGNIYITEWINGTTWSEPKELPKIVIKTEEGELVKECYVSKLEGNKYYFDSYIEGIDTSKRYVLEVELTNSNNTSKNKVGKVDLGEEKVLGEYKDYTLKVEGTTMEFEAKVKAVEKQENNNQVVNSPIKGEEKIVVKENEESKKEETKSIENTTNEVTENEKEEEKPEENKTDKEDETTENEVENNTMTNVIELNETRQNKTNKNITE